MRIVLALLLCRLSSPAAQTSIDSYDVTLTQLEAKERGALAAARAAKGPGSREYIACAMDLARLLLEEAKYIEGDQLTRELLASVPESIGKEDSVVADILEIRARILSQTHRKRDSKKCLQQAIAIRIASRADATALGRTYHNAAVIYTDEGELALAWAAIEQARELWFGKLAEDDPVRVHCETLMLNWYDRAKRYEDANKLASTLLPRIERAIDAGRTEFVNTLQNIATCYLHQGRYSDAVPLFENAYRIDRLYLGELHPTTGYALLGLGVSLGRTGQATEADSRIRQAKAILSLVH